MNALTLEYVHRAELWLLITTLVYFLMNGAQIFETAVIIPKWTADAPKSFSVIKDLDLKTFWIVMHSIHEVTFIAAIVFCWQITEIRTGLLVLFAIHFAVRVWTIAYFAPNIIEFQKIANTGEEGLDLINRARRWKNLNYLRVGLFVAVSLGVLVEYVKVVENVMRK